MVPSATVSVELKQVKGVKKQKQKKNEDFSFPLGIFLTLEIDLPVLVHTTAITVTVMQCFKVKASIQLKRWPEL